MIEHDEMEIDLKEIFLLLKKKILIILLTAVLGAGIAGVITQFFITPIYSSTTQLFVLSQSTSVTSLADIQIGSSLTQDYKELIYTRPVINKVIDNLNLDYTYEEMKDKIAVDNPSDTRFLKITVSDPDPELAQKMADELAIVTAARVSEKMAADAPNIIEEANLPEEADSPSLKVNIAVGGMLGMLLTIGIILVIYMLNDSIRSADEVERYFNLTVLASVPSEKGSLQSKGEKKVKGKR